jgi:hypothetical protein
MVMIRAGGDTQSVPNRVLSDELLGETVEHISEETHGGTAGDGAEVMTIEVEVSVDDVCNVGVVEVLEKIRKNDGAVVEPRLPGLISSEAGEDEFWIEVKWWRMLGGKTIYGEVIWF